MVLIRDIDGPSQGRLWSGWGFGEAWIHCQLARTGGQALFWTRTASRASAWAGSDSTPPRYRRMMALRSALVDKHSAHSAGIY